MQLTRGTSGFHVTAAGDLVNVSANVTNLRRLWLDQSMIQNDDLGPGDDGDFDHGAWHVACHLVAAGGVRSAADGRLLWLELSCDSQTGEYSATVSVHDTDADRTYPLDSAESRALVQGSTLLGFIEGNSLGHISCRGVVDPKDRFNGWTRQQFDQAVDSPEDGGRVWEHWCTTRDIRPSHSIGSSVLSAYVALTAALGDKFVAAVARGRRSYGHPKQLCAMVRAGLVSEEAATWDIAPEPIPNDAESKLLEARVSDMLEAAADLTWGTSPRYYMYARRIDHWSRTDAVRRDLAAFPA